MIIQIVLWDCYTVPYFCFEKRRFMEELKFEELELCPEILKAVKHMGFEEASPIQSKAIPVIMSGKDVIGQAQTGTGKTAAFGIPLLEKIDPKNKKPSGDCSLSDKRAGNPGCRRNQKSCKIYAWDKSSANLWRTGDCKTDPFSEKRHTACDRNTGTCDGSYAPQNYENGSCVYDCAG